MKIGTHIDNDKIVAHKIYTFQRCIQYDDVVQRSFGAYNYNTPGKNGYFKLYIRDNVSQTLSNTVVVTVNHQQVLGNRI